MTPHEQLQEPFTELQTEEIAQDDVVEKVDQFLSRHRAGTPDAADTPAVDKADEHGDASTDDAIPTLTDIVSTSYVPANRRTAPDPAAIDDALILRRLEITLETVRARVEPQIGSNVEQAGLLDQLFAVLKLALPDAVRSTGKDAVAESARPEESPRL